MFVVGDHTAPVLVIVFAPNGLRLASAGKDGTARLWSLGGGPPTVLTGHTDSVTAIAFSPDDDWIATGSADRTVKLWPAAGGPAQALPGPHEGPVTSATFFHGGRLLATGWGNRIDAGEAGGIGIWRTADRSRVSLRGEPNGVWSLAATPTDKTLAWAGGAKRATVWDITSPDYRIFAPHKIGILAVALSADGRTLAATDDWAIRLSDCHTRQELRTLHGHKGRVCALAFSPDGATLLSAGWDSRVTLWDVATGYERRTYAWPIGRPRAVAFAPDGLLAATAGDAGTIVVWDVE